jgi:hypothetical protein
MYPVTANKHNFAVRNSRIYSENDVNFKAIPFIEVSYSHEVLVVLYNEFNTAVIRLYGLPICQVFVTALYKAAFCVSSPPSRVAENTDPWPHDFVTHLTSAQGP